MLGVGVGALVRASAGAVALLLLWPLVAEPLLANMPNTGATVGPYLPFANAFTFLGVQWLYPYYAMPWGHLGSLVILRAAWLPPRSSRRWSPSTGATHDRGLRLTWGRWGANRAGFRLCSSRSPSRLRSAGCGGGAAKEATEAPYHRRPPARRPITPRGCGTGSRATR